MSNFFYQKFNNFTNINIKIRDRHTITPETINNNYMNTIIKNNVISSFGHSNKMSSGNFIVNPKENYENYKMQNKSNKNQQDSLIHPKNDSIITIKELMARPPSDVPSHVTLINSLDEIGTTNNGKLISTDYSLSKDIGYSFIISDKLLGQGSYGDVFLATDENGKQVAVKCCDIDATGIPNILEASIMGSIIHPDLNKALRIQVSDNKLYIIQELAQTDLAQHTRRDKGNYKPSVNELQKWCYSIAQAVATLHNENIIHADIKASNILLYADGSVRLTDYTLATKKWSPGEKFTHNVCTCTHRPLECLTRRSWDESLDIWSLGCTFYEIAYGELLFPYQGAIEPNQKIKDKEVKIRIRNRSINAIIDWANRGPNPPTPYEILGTTQFPIDYIPFALCEEFKRPEMKAFNTLLCKMLIVNPNKRFTIKQILADPFFNGLKPPIYLSIRRPINKISIQEHARVSRYIQHYTNNEIIQNLAMNIYCRCNDLNHISENIRTAVCTWIASKIVVGYTPKLDNSRIPLGQILSAEREICHNLSFRLHSL